MELLGAYALVDKTMMRKIANEEDIIETVQALGEDETVEFYNIDILWDGMHFLLTGRSGQDPDEHNLLSIAVAGKFPFDCDGRVAYTPEEDIPAIVKALGEVDIDALVENMDISAFDAAEIYPIDMWAEKYARELKRDLKDEFTELKNFYTQAEEEGKGVLVSVY